MKKHVLIIFTLILVFSCIFTGCTGADEKVVNTKDGTIIAGDNISWPQDNMGDLAKPNAKITGVIKGESDKSCAVTFSDMTKSDAEAYISAIKQHGYQSLIEFTDDESIMFSGQKNNITVTFTYNTSAKEGSVSYILESSSNDEE
ncbi:MAG: hypothetical protein GYA50_08425 [Eubacteriaceae bacterium]|nr:hypothetical protein [Eubacteriaceae bacterium]